MRKTLRARNSEQLDSVDNTHIDGWYPDNIRVIIDAMTEIAEQRIKAENAEDPIETVETAIWMHIEHMSQRELYDELREADHQNSDEAAELLKPEWQPMSEKAFLSTRDFFSDGEAES